MKRLIALLMALLCLCSFAQAEELKDWIASDVAQPISEWFAEETLITASGSAEADAPIDVAILTFTVKAKGETVSDANRQVMSSIQTIKDVLAAQGVEENHIWYKQYDVSPNVVYHNTKFTEDAVIEGYIVEIELCVRLTDISLVGTVIDTATQSGADASHELAFERSAAQERYDEALAEAVGQAMEKAEHLAQGAGLTLGNLVSLKELSSVKDGEAIVEVTYSAK